MRNFLNHSLYKEDLFRASCINGIEGIKNKTFLVTGATGLIGVCFIDTLMDLNTKGWSVSIYVVARNKEKADSFFSIYYSSPLFHLIVQDVRAPLPLDIYPDYILPLASNTHPIAYSSAPVETLLTNIDGAVNALNLAKECNGTVIYPSSVEIYGNSRNDDVFTEDYNGILNLSTSRACYSESKRSCEALCQSYKDEYGVHVKIARLSRVFGPTMQWSDSKASSQFIKKAILGEDIVLKSDGSQLFSYTYVSDVVKALLVIILKGENGLAYNVSADSYNVRLKDFAAICASIAKRKIVFEIPTKAEAQGYSVATKAVMDNSRLCSLGWTPSYDMSSAIIRTITILKDYLVF